ncbi:MAG: histidine phosphatase family protein [Bdellovibrionales bacterium]|nr:histidine phosphatase family protein [Bdellovibrionales bacterium]
MVRHAIAEDRMVWAQSGKPDGERPLTDSGLLKMKKAAEGLSIILEPPECILTSPLRRAYQTAECLKEVFPLARFVSEEKLASGASTVRELLEVFLEHGRRYSRVVAVFHEPECSLVSAALVDSENRESFQFKKGAAACFDEVGSAAVLRWYLPPKVLRNLSPKR